MFLTWGHGVVKIVSVIGRDESIIIIESNLMLRYAVAVALTPDHGIQFFDSLPESSALEDVDAVIVDAATLQGREESASCLTSKPLNVGNSDCGSMTGNSIVPAGDSRQLGKSETAGC